MLTSATHGHLLDPFLRYSALDCCAECIPPLHEYVNQLPELRQAANEGTIDECVIAERAHSMQANLSVLIEQRLMQVNQQRDLGRGNVVLEALHADPERFGGADFAVRLRDAKAGLAEALPGRDWRWLDDLAETLDRYRFTVSAERSTLRVGLTVGEDSWATTVSMASDDTTARTSVEEFFDDRPGSLFVPTSGAERSADPTVTPHLADWYGGTVEGLAFARELAWRHVRNATELGAPAAEGGAVGTVVAVVVLVVVAATAAAGAVYAIAKLICGDHDAGPGWSCTLADVAEKVGFIGGLILAGLAGGKAAQPSGKQNNGVPSMNFGANPS